MSGDLVPRPSEPPPICELCYRPGTIVNEVPADGGRAVWARWDLSPMLVAWAHPDRHADPVTGEPRTWQVVTRCKDHGSCRDRVRANGEIWEIADGHEDPLPLPGLVAAAAGDDGSIWDDPS